MRFLRSTLAVCVLVASAATARAQGYVVSAASDRVEDRPASAAALDVDSVNAAHAWTSVPIPFKFAYYGAWCTTVVVSAHGWILPGAKTGFADAADPSAAHGQDAKSGAFPYGAGGAGADGIIATLWTKLRFVNDGSDHAGRVYVWTSGAAPARRFIASWENVGIGDGPRGTLQVHLHESAGRIEFAYKIGASDDPSPTLRCVCGLDEPGGARFTATPSGGLVHGLPTSDFAFEPRTVLFNDPSGEKVGAPVTWQRIKRESLSADESARPCCYVAKGEGWFFVPDRVTSARRRAELLTEDRDEFHGATGDTERWIRQVFDAKANLVMKDGTPARFWFRVVELFSVDDRGLAGPDGHLWNLRKMLDRAFPADDPRSKIANYAAWRAVAHGRLTVVKLFDADQKDDAGKQYTSNRKNEYVLWSARYKAGTRGGPLPDHDCPTVGWTRFAMEDYAPDAEAPQRAEKGDLREVVDTNYVDGRYEYVVRADDDPSGWICRAKTRLPAMKDEAVDDDPDAGPSGR